jgi:RNA polymerase sigma-70 factor (ECF subfamily)
VTQTAVAVRARPTRQERAGGRRASAPDRRAVVAAVAAVPRLTSEDGIRAAYREHGGVLLHHAEQSLRDRGLAEEAVQETFVRAWRHADRYDAGIASLRTWLFAILRNVVIDMARARAVRPSLPTEPAHIGIHGARAVDDTEAALTTWELADALAHLSEEHRRAIVETHLRSRSYGEVAAELGIPVGTVRSRVFYGLRALRAVLEERGAA